MKPARKEITHQQLIELCLAKAGGARELHRLTGVGRATVYRLQNHVTKRLQEPTVQKLWGYLYAK